MEALVASFQVRCLCVSVGSLARQGAAVLQLLQVLDIA